LSGDGILHFVQDDTSSKFKFNTSSKFNFNTSSKFNFNTLSRFNGGVTRGANRWAQIRSG